jgi:hypothetical protein
MGDGRTNLFRSMWTRTTTNDTKSSWEYSDTQVKSASLEEQAKHTPWEEELVHMPNQRMHKIVSFIKSGLRLIACIFGMTEMFVVGFALLFMAEVVGIYEEMV